jgi:mRNA interferase MazF
LPVLVLTRELVRPHLSRVTVAPIMSRVRGLSTEVPVGPENGLDHPSVVSCDNVVTVPAPLSRQIGRLLPEQEVALTGALHAASDLEDLPRSASNPGCTDRQAPRYRRQDAQADEQTPQAILDAEADAGPFAAAIP